MKCSPGIFNFLEEISSLSHSIAFLYFFALITEEGFLASPCSSLELCIQMCISFLFSFSFSFSSFSAICKASSDDHFPFLHYFFLGMDLITASCTMSWTSIHSSSGTLSIRSNPLNLFATFTVKSLRDSIYIIPKWSSGFPYFLQLKPEFDNKKSMIWATISSLPWFCWLYRAFPSLASKNIINLISVLAIWWCPRVESSLVLLEVGICYDPCVLLAELSAFALLHSVLRGQICLLLQVCLAFLLLHFSPLRWKGHLLRMLVLGFIGLHKTVQL